MDIREVYKKHPELRRARGRDRPELRLPGGDARV
jgi:hypothetical protein